MLIPTDGLIDENLVKHTKYTISSGEIISYYIDKKIGYEALDRFETDGSGNLIYVDTIKTINAGHSNEEHDFITQTFNKLDEIIDLDFTEMSHNNGSMIDIYHISYSSHFREDVIGQALTQKTNQGGWWDIFWKDTPLTGTYNSNSNYNTIIHEIGHTLGLSHPFNDPKNKDYNSNNTIMSYNPGENGWDTWFSQNDLNALIKIWGRENDNGYISYEKRSKDYKYKKNIDNTYSIKTDIGYEDISNIETLKFTDKSINVVDDVIGVFDMITGLEDISGKLYRLYNAAFARFPDKEGLKYWINNNISLKDSFKDTAKSFISSEEFLNTYGVNSSNENFLSSLYANVLDRSPDIEGFNYWLNQINSGHEARDELLMGFSESAENKSLFSAETNIF